MDFKVKQDENSAEAIRRIARDQIDKAMAEIDDKDMDRHETVHQVRKRCKKIRAVVRLVRPQMEDVYQKENAWYRDSAGALSDIRDAQALVECYDDLLARFSEAFAPDFFAGLRKKLIEHRDQSAASEKDVEHRLEWFYERMKRGRKALEDWPLEKEGFDLFEDGLIKTFGRGRKAIQQAYDTETVEDFHEWRKRVKYHWYHARILQPIWDEPLNSYCDELKNLSDYLGDDHDLAVLEQFITSQKDRFENDDKLRAFLGLVCQRQKELRALARPLGVRVFAEKPKRFGKRIRCYWDAWRNDCRDA